MSVDVEGIVKQLEQSRAQASMGATTANFLVFVDDPKIVDWILDRTASIAENHASRVIIFDGTRAPSKTKIEGDERLVIGARDVLAEKLRSVAHGLIVPNVPVALLWAGQQIVSDERFFALNQLATSLVVDSSRLERDVSAMRELTEYFTKEERFSVRDLAYMRLLPWQDTIAQFFDDAALIEDLFAIDGVEIVSGSQAEAYYLIGWLAGCLEWTPCAKNAFCNRFGTQIAFSDLREGDPRRIVRVTITTPSSSFCVELDAKSADTVCLSITGEKSRPMHCAPLHDISNIALLEKAILEPQTDPNFRKSLEVTRRMLEL
ncbi:MAG: glucose-6-phosphate dehydrogenase assembly protein OpcA [Candidatus Eremiobacteraeota bacterium]|nr:glucose-6-phosphate dehydrogenase assembly protein OpcA [Candidatus Eremiobacteraeota bacterium]